MFPNDIDKSRYPLQSRLWGIFIGTLVMVMVPLAFVTPGTLSVTLPTLFVSILCAGHARLGLSRLLPPVGTGGLIVAALSGYTVASSLWSARPLESLGVALLAGATALACAIMSRSMLQEPRRNILHIAEGLWIGMVAGLLYLMFELTTHQAIKLHVYNLLDLGPNDLRPTRFFKWTGPDISAIDPADLTRSIAPVPLYLWAALLAIKGSAQGRSAQWWMIGTFLLGAVTVAISPNETATLALAAGFITFAIALYRVEWSRRMLQVAWTVVCLAIVPLSLGLHRLNLHNTEWVQPTAQERLVLWKIAGEETQKAPIFGIGIGMAYWNLDKGKTDDERKKSSRTSRDPHNAFLQVWYELGAVGAALLWLLGFALLSRIRRLGAKIAPYALATFASAATTMAASYGIWRTWFMYMFALAVVLFAVGLRAVIRRDGIVRDSIL